MPSLRDKPADLIADLSLYATEVGGKTRPITEGFGCPCFPVGDRSGGAWDARLLLEGEPLYPGQTRRVAFVFLSGERAAEIMRAAGRFYLWEMRDIGEAVVVS
jgi:hypothetical protein